MSFNVGSKQLTMRLAGNYHDGTPVIQIIDKNNKIITTITVCLDLDRTIDSGLFIVKINEGDIKNAIIKEQFFKDTQQTLPLGPYGDEANIWALTEKGQKEIKK